MWSIVWRVKNSLTKNTLVQAMKVLKKEMLAWLFYKKKERRISKAITSMFAVVRGFDQHAGSNVVVM